ncbi:MULTISPECIES: hypothetical protein [unclassified Kitasatospora]|uniref:hypothetical protein n=1 Tax=unclassified Kitasatospora TaxID=2633591 RepID=UPI00070AF846|nr:MULTISPECIES: hypothetical protein [unclassified Kitasatospora]KQV13477.1 hypothetical protein ASC99_33835 [Kitasatospora sp. Root107]KRB69785.1 hypothetical protein ASE03_26530 [Kitasatospora sp. Root187]
MDLPAEYVSPTRHCSRRAAQTGQPCRREPATWPSGYDDLPVQVACRSHLTDEEWAQCLNARKRQNAERRDNQLTLVERAALAEAAPPDSAEGDESPQCRRQCAFVKIPGRSSLDDVSPFYCANCDSAVCYVCGQASVDYEGTMCRPCEGMAYFDAGGRPDDEIDLNTDDIDHGPDPRGRLTRLVNEIAAATGDTHREINARINREVGVHSRVGADETTIRQASAVAAAWLTWVASVPAER